MRPCIISTGLCRGKRRAGGTVPAEKGLYGRRDQKTPDWQCFLNSGTAKPVLESCHVPIQDINHRVIGFGGRVMGDGEPKYLNSPETMIFDKRRNLYGLNFARTARTGNIILCEGYMDVIAMHQAGFTQAVASLGTAFTVEQANLYTVMRKNILLAYDSDGAGTKAALRGHRYSQGRPGLPVKSSICVLIRTRMNLSRIWGKRLFRRESIRRRTVSTSRSVS